MSVPIILFELFLNPLFDSPVLFLLVMPIPCEGNELPRLRRDRVLVVQA
jgi:hypothetical protein